MQNNKYRLSEGTTEDIYQQRPVTSLAYDKNVQDFYIAKIKEKRHCTVSHLQRQFHLSFYSAATLKNMLDKIFGEKNKNGN